MIPPELCDLSSCTGSVQSLQSCLLLKNFLRCPNWRHLSHKVGFSFFILSWMLSPQIIICGSRMSFSNTSLIIGGPISLSSSSLQGRQVSTTSLGHISIISSFVNSTVLCIKLLMGLYFFEGTLFVFCECFVCYYFACFLYLDQ